MTIVVSDTSPVRALNHLELLDLLGVLFDRVLVPPAVQSELEQPKAGFAPVRLLDLPVVEIRAPKNQGMVEALQAELELAESQAIVLALEVQATAVLIDEAAGRAAAARAGLKRVGVLGILRAAKERGRIAAIAPLIDRLQIELRFFVSPDLRAEILRDAGEAES